MNPAIVINPGLQKEAPYDLKDFKIVSLVSSSPLLMVTTAKVAIKDYDQSIKVYPNARAFIYRGQIYYNQAEYDRAI